MRIFLLLALLGALLPAGAAAQPGALSYIGAIYLDANGGGWAWGLRGSAPGAGVLLRLEAEGWVERAQPSLGENAQIEQIAGTASGDVWAVGYNKAGAQLWHNWQPTGLALPSIPRYGDISISADGSDGWLTVSKFDRQLILFTAIYRLRGGQWEAQPAPPAGVLIRKIGISPDGKTAWALGWNGPRSEYAAFRYVGDEWVAVTGSAYGQDMSAQEVAATNDGGGWAIASDCCGYVTSSLIRLSPNAAPQPVSLPVQNLAYPYIELGYLSLGRNGRGWVSGLAQRLNGPDAYKQLLFRLDGANVIPVAPASVGLIPTDQLPPTMISPEGAHTWSAARDQAHSTITAARYSLIELRQPWEHQTPPAAAPLSGPGLCFEAVQYCLRGVFATFWQNHGGLAQLGYPITPEIMETIDGKQYTVQYTQRARLEWHPEFAGGDAEVLLGLLGNVLAAPRGGETPFKPVAATGAGAQLFAATGHSVGPPFLQYWQTHGGIPVFGYPRSEAFTELNEADGKPYLVQYFERNRLEYHPEYAGTPNEILLGLLGVEQFERTYGYSP